MKGFLIMTGIIIYMHYLSVPWRKSVTKINTLGCRELYEIYKVYRKKIKGMLKHANIMYYNKRFDSAKGNMKKHGF